MILEYNVSGVDPTKIKIKAGEIACEFFKHQADPRDIAVEVCHVRPETAEVNGSGETVRVLLWEAECEAWIKNDPNAGRVLDK